MPPSSSSSSSSSQRQQKRLAQSLLASFPLLVSLHAFLAKPAGGRAQRPALWVPLAVHIAQVESLAEKGSSGELQGFLAVTGLSPSLCIPHGIELKELTPLPPRWGQLSFCTRSETSWIRRRSEGRRTLVRWERTRPEHWSVWGRRTGRAAEGGIMPTGSGVVWTRSASHRMPSFESSPAHCLFDARRSAPSRLRFSCPRH